MLKERIEDPLSEGRYGQNDYSVKESKIEKNIEESKIYIVKEENANSNTCILRRSHDQQELRKVTSQRYLIRFHGHCYKCNTYGHKSIHCIAHEKITPERNQSTFSIHCYNFYHYGHFTKHWWI